MKKLAILALLLCCLAMKGQTSSVTATLTDTDGTLWVNGTCTVTLQWSTTKYPTTTPYRVDIGPGTLVPQHPSCTVDGSGVLHVTVTDVKFIYPPNSTWLFTVCPNVYQGNLGCGVTQVPVTGASVNLTGTLKVPAARVGGGIGAFAYADLEVAPLWNNFYWNTTTGKCRQWQNSWADCGSGASGTPGGIDGDIQVNHPLGTFGAAAELNYDFPDHVLNLLNENIAANGFATSIQNQNSGHLVMEGDVWDGSVPQAVYYGQQVVVGTGSNPATIMDYECSTASTSTCAASFNMKVSSVNNLPAGDMTTALASGLNVWQNQPGLIAQYFGAYGDAFKPPDGCNTNGTTTVVCPDGPFVSTDVGKQVWVTGAGVGGAAFNATITAYSSNTTVTVSAAATATLSNVGAVIGHDDTTAVQACIKYSSVNAVQCVLKPAPAPVGQNGLVGYLIGTGSLQLTSNNFLEQSSGPSLIGNSQTQGTNLFCEYNGDCLNLAAGPIQGANLVNLAFEEDPSQPASRGLHFNPQAGTFGNGPFTNSNITNVNVDSPALECLWLDGGGGPGYGYNIPNQYLTFTQFWCNGPNQSHPANLIKATGQDLQIIFLNGQVNGQGWNGTNAPDYANPLINITEKTSTLGDAPVDIKFFGYTCEVATQCLYFGNGTNNLHYDNSYIENVSSPFIVVGSVADTFNGDHIANSGDTTGVFQFSSSSGASVRDALSYGSSPSPAAFAVCSGNNQINFENNNSAVTTNSCLYTTAVSSGTQGANSCSSPASQTITGLTTGSVITPGFSGNPTGIVGWGSTGGMAFKIWPSAANTAQWSVCNATGSSITYGAITFNEIWK